MEHIQWLLTADANNDGTSDGADTTIVPGNRGVGITPP